MRFSAYFVGGGARGGSRLWVEEPELQSADLEALAQQHPKRRVLQFFAQGFEHFVPRIRAVVLSSFFSCVGLGGL